MINAQHSVTAMAHSSKNSLISFELLNYSGAYFQRPWCLNSQKDSSPKNYVICFHLGLLTLMLFFFFVSYRFFKVLNYSFNHPVVFKNWIKHLSNRSKSTLWKILKINVTIETHYCVYCSHVKKKKKFI